MMSIALLIIHGLMAVLLLGALTHQFIGSWWPKRIRDPSFVQRVRAVRSFSYTNAIVLLYILTWIFGALVYPAYVLGPREEFKMEMPPAFGLFEIKEHIAAIGLGILPAYWHSWHSADNDIRICRTAFMTILTAIVWFDFVIGHVLNNLGGL